MNYFNNNESGVALYLMILVLSGVLTIGLTLSALMIKELATAQTAAEYVPAIYGADAGIERALYEVRKNGEFLDCPTGPDEGTGECFIALTALDNGSRYKIEVYDGDVPNEPCDTSDASRCVRSTGIHGETTRALTATF
ncbi:MAG: hypothetical protein WD850_01570 [Candidatus Spechtbacterales bacterium]